MIRRIKAWAAAIGMTAIIGGGVLAIATPTPTFAAGKCAQNILTFPVWFRGLTVSDTDCTLKSPDQVGGLSNYIWKIVLNVIEIVLNLIGYLAVFLIIFGGFQFMTNGGEAAKVEKAKKTILNAVIGLIISIAAIAIVNLIFGAINGFKG
jgi:hypothetical protein